MTDDLARYIEGLALDQRAALERRLLAKRAPAAGSRGIPRRTGSGPAPLSFSQQRLWLLDQLQPGSPLYNISRPIRLSGALDVDALQRALETIVARHESLRTTFIAVDGLPMQVVAGSPRVPLPVTDLTGLPEPEREAEARRLKTAESRRPFDLENGPLFRAQLIRLGQEDHLLILGMHHICSDLWSLGILLRELGVLYRAFRRGKPSPLPDLPIQYADYSVWQRQALQGDALERQLAYWRGRLRGAPPALDLSTDRPRPTLQSARGATRSVLLPVEVADGIKALCRREGVTPFTALLAAFQTLLARYTGQEDIVVGSPIAGRTRAETEGLIGFFVNTLVLRSDLSGDPTFVELLRRVHEVTLDAHAHQDLPFERLVEELQPERDLGRSPLFQVAFALQNVPRQRLELPALTLRTETGDRGTSKFDLTLFMWEQANGLRAALEYSTDLFEAGTITRMLGHLRTLLAGIAAEPERRLSRLPLLTAPERHQVIEEWNATAADLPRETTIHELIAAQAARTPDAVALVGQGEQLTYRALSRRANQLARYLRARGVGPEMRVGVCLDRSPDLVVALLGILQAGGAYVPLDPGYPRERLRFMLADAKVAVLVTEGRHLDRLPPDAGGSIVCLDREEATIGRETDASLPPAAVADNLAYVIYTSGSTGRPKGVALPHRSVVSFLAWAGRATPLPAGLRVLATTSINFDLSVYEIFGTLSWGGTVILAPGPLALPEMELTEPATLLNTVPSAAAALVRLESLPAGLVRINLAGERLPAALVEGLYAAGAGEVYNLYGPTETTVYSTWGRVARGASDPPSIGGPIWNTQAYVLDRRFEPVPVGVPGELYLGGAGLARGYLGRPGPTAERFLPNPFGAAGTRLYRTGDRVRWRADGTLEFLGRLDQQLKIRGYRVEPGEIDALLRLHPAVAAAAVVPRQESPGETRLIAYIVPRGRPAHQSELLGYLARQLPDYMVPAAFVTLDALPLLPNGKLDRAALPAPAAAEPAADDADAAPRTPDEDAIARIWAEVLRVERVGIHDDFFALGGHSLLATQVVSRVRARLGVELPLRDLFEQPTVAGLVGRLRSAREAGLADFPGLDRVARRGA